VEKIHDEDFLEDREEKTHLYDVFTTVVLKRKYKVYAKDKYEAEMLVDNALTSESGIEEKEDTEVLSICVNNIKLSK
jgi:hypothetical protein